MGELVDSSLNIEKVRRHLRQYSLEIHTIVCKRTEEKVSELAELASIYDMLHSLKTSMAKDMEVLELYLGRPENQTLWFTHETSRTSSHG